MGALLTWSQKGEHQQRGLSFCLTTLFRRVPVLLLSLLLLFLFLLPLLLSHCSRLPLLGHKMALCKPTAVASPTRARGVHGQDCLDLSSLRQITREDSSWG